VTNMDESELRQRFARLREVDGERLPGFAQTYERARARRRLPATPRMRPLMIGAAAALAIAAVLLGRGQSLSSSVDAPAITSWRAPTDVFLSAPGAELLGAMPALSTSVLDQITLTPSQKGA
jgi:hypothetical protein